MGCPKECWDSKKEDGTFRCILTGNSNCGINVSIDWSSRKFELKEGSYAKSSQTRHNKPRS